MKIEIINNSGQVISPHINSLIENIARLSLQYENINPDHIDVDITIVDDDEIREINGEYRGKDSVTDVLSFPMTNFDIGEAIPNNGDYMLGDIVFSIETAFLQAKEYEHSLEREVGFLIAHSMLHLMGYDHMEPEEEEIMIQKQEAILALANLSR